MAEFKPGDKVKLQLDKDLQNLRHNIAEVIEEWPLEFFPKLYYIKFPNKSDQKFVCFGSELTRCKGGANDMDEIDVERIVEENEYELVFECTIPKGRYSLEKQCTKMSFDRDNGSTTYSFYRKRDDSQTPCKHDGEMVRTSSADASGVWHENHVCRKCGSDLVANILPRAFDRNGTELYVGDTVIFLYYDDIRRRRIEYIFKKNYVRLADLATGATIGDNEARDYILYKRDSTE